MTLILSLTTLFSIMALFAGVIIFAALSLVVVAGHWAGQNENWLAAKVRPWAARLVGIIFGQGHFEKWYTWEFSSRAAPGHPAADSRFFLELPISKTRYMEYRQRPRNLDPSHFDTYVTMFTPEVERLATKLLQISQEQHFSAYEQVCNILAFVQDNVAYTADLSAQTGQLIEYPKYPIETLVEKRGDCEDQAILAASILARLGYSVALLILPTHVALGVAGFADKPGSRVIHAATDTRYLYVETTGPGWLPGEVPLEFRPHLASGQFEILPVVTAQESKSTHTPGARA